MDGVGIGYGMQGRSGLRRYCMHSKLSGITGKNVLNKGPLLGMGWDGGRKEDIYMSLLRYLNKYSTRKREQNKYLRMRDRSNNVSWIHLFLRCYSFFPVYAYQKLLLIRGLVVSTVRCPVYIYLSQERKHTFHEHAVVYSTATIALLDLFEPAFGSSTNGNEAQV